ncbi:MAG: restriction endonuclease subunit S [Methanosarcina sp.]|nr:restriction endonuclease subunit S [Methanosarcina sp.]
MIHNLKPYPAYKDSGVPWLGEVPEHWKFDRAKWLFQKMNRPVRSDDDVVTCFRDGVVTLRKNRRVSGFTESLKEIGYQGVRRGDLVIHAMDAFAGAIGVSDSEGKCTPVYAVCQPREDVNSHYYAYIVREMARSQWIAALAKGIRERSTDFRFDGFASQNVPIPPREEQDKIAIFIDHIDRRIRRYIRSKQKLIKLLEEQKQVIIHQAVTRGLDPNVKLKPSGVEWLGDVPEHWEIISLSAASELIQTGPFGSQLHSHEYIEGGVPVINPSHMQSGCIVPDMSISISQSKADSLQRHKLQLGDIIAARRGELGRCALVTVIEEDWICGTGSLQIRCKKSIFDPEYLLQLFSSQGIRDSLSISSIGATMDNLNSGMVSRLRLPLPFLDEQRRIIELINVENKKSSLAVSAIKREISLLREYRTRLIADVVTGKLDVRDAAASLPEETNETETFDDSLAEEGLEDDEIEDEQAGELEEEVLA